MSQNFQVREAHEEEVLRSIFILLPLFLPLVMVVVGGSDTMLMTDLWRSDITVFHLILGGPCLCGHDSPGPAPVCRALKITPSAHHRDDELHTTSFNESNRGSTTVSSTTAPVELARPAHESHKPPCRRNLCGQRDHGDQPLRHDRFVLHDLCNRDIDHRGPATGDILSSDKQSGPMGIGLCTTMGKSTSWKMSSNCENPQFAGTAPRAAPSDPYRP